MAEYLLEVRGLNVGYGQVDVLRGVSLKAPKEGVAAIIGPNGAGKSTLLKAIMNYIVVSHGTVSFDGHAITGLPTHKTVMEGIGYVPQGEGVFPEMTIKENLEVGAYQIRRNKGKRGRLTDRVFEIFPRLKERSWQLAGTLSGGERQMLAIGRALMGDPRMILLDEPSLGLSPIVLKAVYSTIKELKKQGVSILLVEQNAAAAMRVADYVYVLELGQIRNEGDRQEIIKNEGIKRHYFGIE